MFDVFTIPRGAASIGSPAIASKREQRGKHRQPDVAYFYSYMAAKTNKTIPQAKWNIEKETILFNHDCLFNVSCETYHNRTDKEKMWAELVSVLEVTCERMG